MGYYDYDDNDLSDNGDLDEIFALATDMDLQIYMTEDEHHEMSIVFPELLKELDNMNFNIDGKDVDGVLLSLKKYLLANDFVIKDTVNETIKALKLKKKKVVAKPATESMYNSIRNEQSCGLFDFQHVRYMLGVNAIAITNNFLWNKVGSYYFYQLELKY